MVVVLLYETAWSRRLEWSPGRPSLGAVCRLTETNKQHVNSSDLLIQKTQVSIHTHTHTH